MHPRIIDTLKRSQLSVTDSRKKILELFLERKAALAHADIEQHSGDEFDRVTIYRTLQTFVEKGIHFPLSFFTRQSALGNFRWY